MERVPFNAPCMTGNEMRYIGEVIASGRLYGDGDFTRSCEEWLAAAISCRGALLVSSCTSALEMAALLINAGPGDEVIVPSFAFVSTANAFAMRGAMPVFVDIRPDTLNIDEARIESAITKNTKAIVLLHYAGVACAVEPILALAKKHKLFVIEDNAHGLMASYGGKPLGSFGDLAALSFHETKNITCGQGGALIVNDQALLERAYVLRDKGTNRRAFEEGRAPFYSWVDQGSNWRLSELQAAFLSAQLEAASEITQSRRRCWERYREMLKGLALSCVRLPSLPEGCRHNGHIFYLLLESQEKRDSLIRFLAGRGIDAPFHYLPLHRAPAYRPPPGRIPACPVTDSVSAGLIRLPLWVGVEKHQERIVAAIAEWAEAY